LEKELQLSFVTTFAPVDLFLGIREAFLSGDHEPYVFRGGLTADLQRLMPVDSGNDLFMYQYPDHPTNIVYKIRPFKPQVNLLMYLYSGVYIWKNYSTSGDFEV